MVDSVVWLVGGGSMQRPMAQEIKRRGHLLLVTDRDPDCICRELADIFVPIDVYDERAHLTCAQYRIHSRVIGVLGVGVDAGPTVSELAAHYGLPAASPEAARRARNKSLMRAILDLPHPTYWAGWPDEIGNWHTFPCVVKSDNASGTQGFSIVHNPLDLPAALDRAERANRDGARVVVEELLLGEDVMPSLPFDTSEAACDYFVEDGKVHYANGALRLFHRDRPGIEAGHFNPFVPDDRMMKLAQYAAEKLGVTFGPFKLDWKLDKRYGWTILEAATRLSGGYDHMYSAVMATGKDITGAMLDLALGLRLDHDKLKPKKNRVACCLAPVFKPGRIEGWHRGDIPDDVLVFYRTRAEIKPLVSNGDRPLFIIADGANHKEAFARATEIAGRIQPVYAKWQR